MSEAVEAMIDWCNEQGGINGRTVVGNYYDAAILNATNVMAEACTQVFMLVGQGWALDGGAEETRVNCKLPQVPGYTVSATVAHGPLTYVRRCRTRSTSPRPAAPTSSPSSSPTQVKKAATVYADFAANVEVDEQGRGHLPELGLGVPQDCRLRPTRSPAWPSGRRTSRS